MKLRRTKLVRVHLRTDERSFEGILTGLVSGHYRLENARLITDPDTSHSVGEAWIPRADALFVQVLQS